MNAGPLTIGYDASVTLSPQPGGIARYALELLRALVALPQDDLRFVILLNSFRHQMDERHAFLLNNPRVTIVRKKIPGPIVVEGWRLLQHPTWERLTSATCDLVHGPANYIPPTRSPVVVTVHDLGFLRDDEAKRALLAGKYFRSAFPRQLPQASAIITPSHFVAEELIKEYQLDAPKVHAIHSGIDRGKFSPEKKLTADALRAIGISGKFVLAVTSSAQRKRADWIPKIAELLDDSIQVVAVGLPAEYASSRIVALNGIGEEMLSGLYATASAVLLTTREEGFGFPVLEALASGTPMVCGRNSSLMEIGGDCAVYTEEDSPVGFAESVNGILANPPSEERRAAGIAHARSFTWRRCAEQVVEVYRRVGRQGPY